ncbi:MAG: NUDIX domain-containing protein [Bacilli bacterium]|nr:NUDIX domain-containing protein [Bacilli bacterium]
MDGKTYESEAEFLKDYDSSAYEKLSITTDILIMSVASEETGNYRKLSEKKFSILLVKRNNYPFKSKWCLPGGFVKIDETLDDAARRILKNETNLKDIYVEQLYTFGDVNRDPRMRVVSTAYMALVDKNRLNDKLSDDASWFNVLLLEDDKEYHVTLDNGSEQIKFVVARELRDLTTDRYDFKVVKNDKLAFDHPLVIISGIERLKNKIEYTDIVFNMMPEYFTLGELQQVYEVILGKKLLDPAFRRIIANKVIKTDKVKTGGGHRPSALFKYKNEKDV